MQAKLNFHIKSVLCSLAFIMRFTATWKWLFLIAVHLIFLSTLYDDSQGEKDLMTISYDKVYPLSHNSDQHQISP